MSKLDTILVVDDDEINRKVAGLFLQRMGWKTDQASSAYEALEQLQQHDYHCVLLDISMPGMSGIELCCKLRAEPRWQDLRLIAYTAHAMSDEQDAMLKAGFNAIVTKPLTRDSLVAALAMPE
ncbi:sensory box histidine kinase [Aquitalea magnusonii]|jgi:CheY-like chemotaxis protein|uniref:Sensory box histidine kinase n=1 Tax=Aquitalea magnusonii TaxID=332411 RepID=A0A3G9GJM8_9NEIS|nr:response regulator [Aquitalea magnusonii]BBF86312.1 sensory box histidine kinase [Aquitalea magnusonii]